MDTAAIQRIQHSKKCNASFFVQSRQHALGDSIRDKIEFGILNEYELGDIQLLAHNDATKGCPATRKGKRRDMDLTLSKFSQLEDDPDPDADKDTQSDSDSAPKIKSARVPTPNRCS